jgi:predicted AAA+ superfamily ATPase
MTSERARLAWFQSYLQAIIDTDIRESARVDEPSSLRRLLLIAAASSAQELNSIKASSDLQLHRTTTNRYLGLLETAFLIRFLPAWSRNFVARAIRRPKLHVTDTGLAANLLGVDAAGLAARVSPARGPLMESFVVNELAKQATWSSVRPTLYHWRLSQGSEVDIVIERANHDVVGIEVKASDTVNADDFKGLVRVRGSIGDSFIHGFVLYTGARPLSFGDRLTALPISTLWQT